MSRLPYVLGVIYNCFDKNSIRTMSDDDVQITYYNNRLAIIYSGVRYNIDFTRYYLFRTQDEMNDYAQFLTKAYSQIILNLQMKLDDHGLFEFVFSEYEKESGVESASICVYYQYIQVKNIVIYKFICHKYLFGKANDGSFADEILVSLDEHNNFKNIDGGLMTRPDLFATDEQPDESDNRYYFQIHVSRYH